MNHKSLISVLTLSTMLTACGGGGGGSGHVPTTTLPNNPSASNQQLTQMKTSVSNESERVVYVVDAYGIPANARPFSISLFSSSSSCLEKTCVDAAFDNMKNLLIDETTENLVETDDLRQALKLAGYRADIIHVRDGKDV